MVMEWSTHSAPPAQRFDRWHEACSQHVYALTPHRSTREPFQGAIVRRQLGSLDVTDIVCDGHVVQRREQDIGDSPSDTYYVYFQRRGQAWFQQQGQRCVAEPGDIVIADPDIPFTTGTDGTFDFRLWRLNRAWLAHLLPLRQGQLPMRRLGREHASRALMASWLDELLRHEAVLSPRALEPACRTLYALVADAVGCNAEHNDPVRLARRRALLQRVMRQTELRSSDMDLTPEHVASEFGLSVRSLHQLFELSEHSFHEFLVRSRLHRARVLLMDPSSRHLGTADIGFAVGFRETSTFYRRFRQQYGNAPGAFRKATPLQ